MGRSDRWLEMKMIELDSYIDENQFPKVYIDFLGKNTGSDSSLFLSFVLP